MAVGAQYKPIEALRLNAGMNYYMDKQALKYNSKQDLLDDNTLESIPAYVIKDGKATEIELYIQPMTENERKIVKAGCLINYNRNGQQ